MTDRQETCFEPAFLAEFLHERLSEAEESTVVSHLDECTHCQQTLEGVAANDVLWSEVKDIQNPHDTQPRTSSHRDQIVQSVMDFLGPTDDPQMMGRLGSYEICGIVGRGSAGVVLKAFDQRLHRYVAIKVLAPNFASHGSARARFEREARAVAAVAHEHVVPIYAVEEHRNLPYLVMQFAGGGSLQQRIDSQGPMEPCEVARIGMQVASGLAAAHAQGIVHRDVKPANVMLESGVDRAMVTDFGLARVVDDASVTRSGAITGTPQFMSPEQAKGEYVDHRSDLFSLGSLMYTAIAGRPPFRSETVYGVIRRVCESEIRPLREINPTCPKWLESFVDKLCQKDRERRFQSANEVRDALAEEVAHLQSPMTVTEPPRNWWKRDSASPSPQLPSKTWIGGSFVAAACILMFLTWRPWENNLILPAGHSPADLAAIADMPVFESRLTRAVPVEEGGRLKFAAGRASVSLRPSDCQQLDIWVTRKVSAETQEQAAEFCKLYDLNLQFDTKGVIVETVLSAEDQNALVRFGEFEIIVFVPEGYKTEISTSETWKLHSPISAKSKFFGLLK